MNKKQFNINNEIAIVKLGIDTFKSLINVYESTEIGLFRKTQIASLICMYQVQCKVIKRQSFGNTSTSVVGGSSKAT